MPRMTSVIRELRLKKALSVRELSQMTGIPAPTIFSWENGTRDIRKATLANAVAVANALDTDVAELLR